MASVRIVITGIVQGVCFRAETQKKAIELGLTGWVRNCDDGSVEILAEGTEEKLRELEQWCHRGPPKAQVSSVEVAPASLENAPSFDIRR